MWVFLLVHFYMFGHDFVLMFMLAHFFKPIRLIACMFGNKSSHLGWVMSSCCNLYFLSITWFFIPLHVKPVGLVFMCILYDKDMHHLLCMSSPWGHFQIQFGHCIWGQQMPLVFKNKNILKTIKNYFKKVQSIPEVFWFLLKPKQISQEYIIDGFSNMTCYNASIICFLFILLDDSIHHFPEKSSIILT